MEVDRCPEGQGLWLDHDEMAELEDRVAGEDMVKGQMRYGEHDSELACPHCGKTMRRFRYRAYNLGIDACPDEAGFWLDKGEDQKIEDVIRQRASNLRRSGAAEVSWRRVRRGGRGPSLVDRIKGFFRG